MQKVAFFDIDGTVFRSSLLIELVETLIERDVFPRTARDVYLREKEAWRTRNGTYEEYIERVIEAFLLNIPGVYYGDFADVGRTVVEEQSGYVYRYTRDLIHELKREGYYLVAISQSPKTILDEFCSAYGFDKVYGRMYELNERECFTGKVKEEHLIKDKSLIVARVMGKGGFTPLSSVGVGDTEGDIPLLSNVERPICFNPNKSLYDHAKNSGWEIVVERKDVIYTQ